MERVISDLDELEQSSNVSTKASNVIDVAELSRMVEKGQSDIRNLQDKNVVLVLGKTGVGKSTFIQLLNGAKIRRNDIGDSVYCAVEDEKFLHDFPIGYERKSETKLIRSYAHTPSGLVFCDMPGYKDTDSFHVDISAAVWINDIARVAKSLRIIVLIQGTTLYDDKGEPFRDLMNLLTKLSKNNPESIAPSLMVFFTHMSDQFPNEQDETAVLKQIGQEIYQISKAKNHSKNVLMKLLRDFITLKTGNVRVLNPVSTDIGEVVKFIKRKVYPLASAHKFVQCSLCREIEMVVSFAMDKMETSIQSALNSCDTVKQQGNLLELFRLLVVFAKMLRTGKYRDMLEKTVVGVVDAYKQCLDAVMKVVDSTTYSSSSTVGGGGGRRRVGLIGREEVELVVPQFNKLKILDQILGEVGTEGYSVDTKRRMGEINIGTNGVESLQWEYLRKCLLIKINTLGMIRTSLDFTDVLQQIKNLSALNYLGDAMGELCCYCMFKCLFYCHSQQPHLCT